MKKLSYTLAAFALPFFAFAQGATNPCPSTTGGSAPTNLKAVACVVIDLINTVGVFLVCAVALIVFIYGVYQYFVAGAANEEKRSDGQKFVMWSLIGFFIMFSVWGLVNILVGTFGLGGAARPTLPTFERSGSVSGGTNTSGTTGAGAGNTNTNGAGETNPIPGQTLP